MKQSDWISVEDRLPRANKEVVVVCSNGSDRWLRIATPVRNDFNELRWYTQDGWDIDPSYITHWQHIVLPKREKL